MKLFLGPHLRSAGTVKPLSVAEKSAGNVVQETNSEQIRRRDKDGDMLELWNKQQPQ